MSWHEDMGGDIDFPEDMDDDSGEQLKLNYLMIARESNLAWLITFEIEGTGKPVQEWIPKSQCSLGNSSTIWVPVWLVAEKGLEAYVEE